MIDEETMMRMLEGIGKIIGEDAPIVSTVQGLKDENTRLRKALERPCLSCGYKPKQIIPMEENNG